MISLEDTFGFDFLQSASTSEEFRGGLIGCASGVVVLSADSYGRRSSTL